jgi:hypothetical protein
VNVRREVLIKGVDERQGGLGQVGRRGQEGDQRREGLAEVVSAVGDAQVDRLELLGVGTREDVFDTARRELATVSEDESLDVAETRRKVW